MGGVGGGGVAWNAGLEGGGDTFGTAILTSVFEH